MALNPQHEVKRPTGAQPGELAAPPRLLFWLIIGLFVLGIVGGVTGVVVFRNVLRPGQQQRIIDMLPFMSALLDKPDPGATLPTVVPPTGAISPDDLLNSPLVSTTDEPTPLPPTPTEVAPTPVSALPTASLHPTTTPTPPTATPTMEPTAESLALTVASLGGVGVAQADTGAEPPPAPQVAAASVDVGPDIPSAHRLYGFTHVEQTWNNCGPANITMALSYYGWQGTQEQAAEFLKPDREDKNVNPAEMVSYVNEASGVRAITRIGGDLALLKQLVAAEFAVIVESGYAPEGYDWIGHYRTIVGYDDSQQLFYLYDSYLGTGANGEGLAVSYDQLDQDWQAFNRVFIALYTQEREAEVAAILGERADVTRAAELALTTAQQEARANPQNEYAWFNMGSSLVRLGRYEEDAAAYDRAVSLGLSFRMLWYQFGLFEAYYNMQRYDDVLSYVTSNLNNGGSYVEETYYWQGRAYAAQGRRDLAADAFRRALTHNPRYTAAQEALAELGV